MRSLDDQDHRVLQSWCITASVLARWPSTSTPWAPSRTPPLGPDELDHLSWVVDGVLQLLELRQGLLIRRAAPTGSGRCPASARPDRRRGRTRPRWPTPAGVARPCAAAPGVRHPSARPTHPSRTAPAATAPRLQRPPRQSRSPDPRHPATSRGTMPLRSPSTERVSTDLGPAPAGCPPCTYVSGAASSRCPSATDEQTATDHAEDRARDPVPRAAHSLAVQHRRQPHSQRHRRRPGGAPRPSRLAYR